MMKGIILGSVTDSFQNGMEILEKETPYGSAFYFIDGECESLVYILRHGKKHEKSPTHVSYKANAEALKYLGVEEVVSVYAVGSVTDKLSPGSFSVIEDFIDFSKPITFFEDEVRHMDFSNPFDSTMKTKLKDNLGVKTEVVYFTTFGPRLETRAEVRAIKALGGDVVGMTLGKEVPLLLEKGIRVASVAFSINWASGVKEKLEFLTQEKESLITKKIIGAARKTLLF